MEINVDQRLRPSFRHELSRTSKITKVQTLSNYGKPGHFAFEIASEEIDEPFCK